MNKNDTMRGVGFFALCGAAVLFAGILLQGCFGMLEAEGAEQPNKATLNLTTNQVLQGSSVNFFSTNLTALLNAIGGNYATPSQGALADTALQPAAIGVTVQAYDADLDTWATKTAPSGVVVGTTDPQTLSIKTLTSPVINVTSDATGDIYYRSAGGLFTRLGIGSSSQVLTVAGGLPSWAAAGSGTVTGITNAGGTYSLINNSNAPVPKIKSLSISGGTLTDEGTNILVTVSGGGSSYADKALTKGRLTVVSGQSVVTTNATNTTVYFTPHNGNGIALYDGSSTWTNATFTEITCTVPSTTATLYDVFIYDNGSAVVSDVVAWASDTARTTALILQDGIYVKTGATTRKYVGTFCTTETAGQVVDTLRRRLVYNYYNKISRTFLRQESTVSWVYSTATLRQVNANSANQVEVVIGVRDTSIALEFIHFAVSGSTGNFMAAIGENSTSAVATNCIGGVETRVAGYVLNPKAHITTIPRLGYSYYAMLEMPTAACTWYSTLTVSGAVVVKHGLTGRIDL